VLDWGRQAGVLSEKASSQIDPDVPWRLRRFFRPEYPAVTAAQYVDLHTFLVDEILSKVDRASMACGVEVRVPLLDVELVELAFSIPSHLVYGRGERKALLKQAAAGLLPPEVLTARKKGFSVPMNAWMQTGLKAWARPLVVDGTLVEREVFDRAGVARRIDEGPPKHTWLLLVAELWARRWLAGGERPGRHFDFREIAYTG
jgi:asparagine synthase (glutamine-hydrolysing)